MHIQTKKITFAADGVQTILIPGYTKAFTVQANNAYAYIFYINRIMVVFR
jgi:Cu/Ag efflux protein CusF